IAPVLEFFITEKAIRTKKAPAPGRKLEALYAVADRAKLERLASGSLRMGKKRRSSPPLSREQITAAKEDRQRQLAEQKARAQRIAARIRAVMTARGMTSPEQIAKMTAARPKFRKPLSHADISHLLLDHVPKKEGVLDQLEAAL